jgi:hypothetical protein
MKNLLRPVNTGAITSQISGASRGGGTKGKFHKFEDNTKYFWHLLPPWEGSNVYGKEVWECFGLPAIPGRRWFRHTLWQTFEANEPGIAAQDPVLAVLQHFKPQMEEQIKRMLPLSGKFYLNAILVGSTKITPDGTPIADTYEKERVPLIKTFGVSGPTFTKIMNIMVAADSTEPGRLDNPYAAGMIGILKKNDGKQIRYDADVVGSMTPQGNVPTRYNLVEDLGEAEVERLYTSIPNLDKMFPPPSEAEKVECANAARALKEVLSAKAAQSGAQAVPQGTQTAPNGALTNQAPPTAAALPGPAEAAPAASQYTSKDIVTRDLGLKAAPTNADGKPLCFGHIAHVEKSPNAYWCPTCPWANSCKLMKGTA